LSFCRPKKEEGGKGKGKNRKGLRVARGSWRKKKRKRTTATSLGKGLTGSEKRERGKSVLPSADSQGIGGVGLTRPLSKEKKRKGLA